MPCCLSLRDKKAAGLAAAFGLLHLLSLVFVQDLEVGAPAEDFLGRHRGTDLVQTFAEFLGDAELQQEPVVLAYFGA